MKKAERALDVISKEICALESLKEYIGESFSTAVDYLYACAGKIIVMGVGKSGHIAGKIAATMSSLGSTSFFLHPDDALHGDLGMISEADVVIAISYSGESDEILQLLPGIKLIGAKLIAITHNTESGLAKNADLVCLIPKVEEACVLGIAPTSSTTVTLAFGDALAVALSEIRHLTREKFAAFHPAGALGKGLTARIADIMRTDENIPVVPISANIKDAIVEIGKKEIGAVLVCDEERKLAGIVTDGDLRRAMEKGVNIYTENVCIVMTRSPIIVNRNMLAMEALSIMKKAGKRCSVLPVIGENRTIEGILSTSDILKLGIVY